MSHPCAKILGYSKSMFDCACIIFQTLTDWISKTRHPCAFLQSLSENIDHPPYKKFSGGHAKMKAPWRCQVESTLSPYKIIWFGITLLPWVWVLRILVGLKLWRWIVQDWERFSWIRWYHKTHWVVLYKFSIFSEMSYPCANFPEYSNSMVDCAAVSFETLKASFSKTRHPCAFLQSLSKI